MIYTSFEFVFFYKKIQKCELVLSDVTCNVAIRLIADLTGSPSRRHNSLKMYQRFLNKKLIFWQTILFTEICSMSPETSCNLLIYYCYLISLYR